MGSPEGNGCRVDPVDLLMGVRLFDQDISRVNIQCSDSSILEDSEKSYWFQLKQVKGFSNLLVRSKT